MRPRTVSIQMRVPDRPMPALQCVMMGPDR